MHIKRDLPYFPIFFIFNTIGVHQVETVKSVIGAAEVLPSVGKLVKHVPSSPSEPRNTFSSCFFLNINKYCCFTVAPTP